MRQLQLDLLCEPPGEGSLLPRSTPPQKPLMCIYTTFSSRYLTPRAKVCPSFLCWEHWESHSPWDRLIEPHLRPQTYTSLLLRWNRWTKWSMLSQGGRLCILVSCLEKYNEFRQAAHNRQRATAGWRRPPNCVEPHLSTSAPIVHPIYFWTVLICLSKFIL